MNSSFLSKLYLHVDNGGNCTPLSLHSRVMRAFTFRQMSNTLETENGEVFSIFTAKRQQCHNNSLNINICIYKTCSWPCIKPKPKSEYEIKINTEKKRKSQNRAETMTVLWRNDCQSKACAAMCGEWRMGRRMDNEPGTYAWNSAWSPSLSRQACYQAAMRDVVHVGVCENDEETMEIMHHMWMEKLILGSRWISSHRTHWQVTAILWVCVWYDMSGRGDKASADTEQDN